MHNKKLNKIHERVSNKKLSADQILQYLIKAVQLLVYFPLHIHDDKVIPVFYALQYLHKNIQ